MLTEMLMNFKSLENKGVYVSQQGFDSPQLHQKVKTSNPLRLLVFFVYQWLFEILQYLSILKARRISHISITCFTFVKTKMLTKC
nr:MAG TPA: hypothetical protein [Caudoviricetes sp.]